MARSIADHQAAESHVADEDIGAEAKHEVLDLEIPGSSNCPCQIICRCCIVKEIGWTTDLECGVLTKRLIALEPLGIQPTSQFPVRFRVSFN